MISYEDLQRLDGDNADELRVLIDRRQELSDLPLSRGRVTAFEALYREAERLEVPHFMASARYEQHQTLLLGGEPLEALDYYLQLLELTSRYAEFVHPANRAAFRRDLPAVVTDLLLLDSFPLSEVRRIIGLVEKQAHEQDGSLADIHLANAVVSAAIGDQVAALRQLEQWRMEDDPDWSTAEDGTARIEVGVLDQIDLSAAIERQQFYIRDLELDEAGYLFHTLTFASLLSQAGRQTEADRLVAGLTADEVGANAQTPFQDQLRALEGRSELAELVVSPVIMSVDLSVPGEYPIVAALARTLLRREHLSPDGLGLMRVAEAHAKKLDERNGTDANQRRLAERWWPGLPAVGEPAGDEEVAEILERAIVGRLERPVRTVQEAPSTLFDSYGSVSQVGGIFSAPDLAAAQSIADRIRADGERLRFPTAVGYAVYAMAGYHLSEGDRDTALDLVFETQDLFGAQADDIDPVLLGLFADSFAIFAESVFSSPAYPLERIHGLLDAHERFVRDNGFTLQPVVTSRALLAAQLGDLASLESLLADSLELLPPEGARVGLPELRAVLAVGRSDETTAKALLESLPESVTHADDDIGRNVDIFRAHLLRREGRGADAAAIAERVFEEVERDLEEVDYYTPLAYFVSAMDASDQFDALLEPLEEAVRKGMPITWESLAAIAGVLLRRDPSDRHGTALLAEATAHAEALDRRNGNTAASGQMRELWL